MSKNDCIVAIGDLHLSTWVRNSPTKDYRMRVQPLKLAERVSDIMTSYDTDYFFILGDLINDWNESPQVLTVLRDFYQTIIDRHPNCFIGYIVGQHDLLIRDRFEKDNSDVHIVSDLFPNNVHYMHDKYMELNNTSIYCSSYNRKGVMYPEKHTNVFLSHISLGFVDVDESSFDLCVAGDIHALFDMGKCHSTSTPYQLHPSQEQVGYISVISLRGKDSTVTRIPSDSSNFEFLKFDPVQKRKVKKVEGKKEQDLKLNENLVMDMIKEEVIKNGVEKVHNAINVSDIPTPVNFKFQLKKLVIDNVRSIEHLELNLDEFSGINYVKGATGSGKSTIFYSIITALIGAGREELLRKTNKITKKALHIQLSLSYDDNDYAIDRSVKGVQFYINGELQNLGKRDTEKKIREHLPFIEYYKYFYLTANHHYFESINKTELMRVLFNLKVFDYLYRSSLAIFKETTKEIKRKNESLIALNARLDSVTTNKSNLISKLDEYNDLTEVNSDDLHADISSYNNCLSLESKIISDKTRQESILEEKEKLLNSLKIEDSITQLNSELSDLTEKLLNCSKSNEQYNQIKTTIVKLETKLEALKSVKVVVCPHCGGILHGQDEEQIEKLTKELEVANSQYVQLKYEDPTDIKSQINETREKIRKGNEYNSLQLVIANIKLALSELGPKLDKVKLDEQKILDKYKSDSEHFLIESNRIVKRLAERDILLRDKSRLDDELKSLESQITSTKSEIDELQTNQALVEKYNKLFDIQDLSSIPYNILNKLVHYLNTDDIVFESSSKSEDEFDINAYIKVANEWISYDDASDGQKNYLDMFIVIRISSFLGGVGFLIMDEPLVNMDPEYVGYADNLLSDISADTIFVSSHAPLTGYDRLIEVAQNEKGITTVKFN